MRRLTVDPMGMRAGPWRLPQRQHKARIPTIVRIGKPCGACGRGTVNKIWASGVGNLPGTRRLHTMRARLLTAPGLVPMVRRPLRL